MRYESPKFDKTCPDLANLQLEAVDSDARKLLS